MQNLWTMVSLAYQYARQHARQHRFLVNMQAGYSLQLSYRNYLPLQSSSNAALKFVCLVAIEPLDCDITHVLTTKRA